MYLGVVFSICDVDFHQWMNDLCCVFTYSLDGWAWIVIYIRGMLFSQYALSRSKYQQNTPIFMQKFASASEHHRMGLLLHLKLSFTCFL